MSSTNKTPALGLNLWEPDDAPLRADFNSDNLLIDTMGKTLQGQIGILTTGVQELRYQQYRTDLQNYYDGKSVPSRATLFFDGFLDTSMIVTAETTARISSGTMQNLEEQYTTFTHAFFDLYQPRMGLVDGVRYTQVAQSFLLPGPFRLFQYTVSARTAPSLARTWSTSIWTTNDSGIPSVKVAEIEAGRAMSADVNTEFRPRTVSLASPLLIPSGCFAMVFSCPDITTNSQTENIQIGSGAPKGFCGSVFHYNGTAWSQDTATARSLYLPLFGALTETPPQIVSKTVALSRPCRKAVVYLTENATALGTTKVYLLAGNAGTPAVSYPMERQTGQTITMSGGQVEEAFTVSVPDSFTQTAVRIVLESESGEAAVSSYGCILSE